MKGMPCCKSVLLMVLVVFLTISTTLAAPGRYIAVVSPNGGEQWRRGYQYTIRWNSSLVNGNVKIILKKDGRFYRNLTGPSGVPNTGTFLWTIQDDIEPGADYRIKVSTLDNSVSDKSNGDFQIYYLIEPAVSNLYLLSPAGGETVTMGSDYRIRWGHQGITGKVVIVLKRGGTRVLTITPPGGVPVSQGSLSWHVPTDLPSATDYRIVIRTTDGLHRYSSPDIRIVTLAEMLPSSDKIKKVNEPDFSNLASLLPDIAVINITISQETTIDGRQVCYPMAVIKNLGPGMIPDYDSGAGNALIRFYRVNPQNGIWEPYAGIGYTLNYVDPLMKLRHPGGEIRVRVPGTGIEMPPGTTEVVVVEFDVFKQDLRFHNYIKEANEQNNTLRKAITCPAMN